MTTSTLHAGQRPAEGLYDPAHEHDACGVGFVVDIKGRKSHAIVDKAIQVLVNLLHRGACGCEPNTGDGAGITIQMPDRFLRRECARMGVTLPPVDRVRRRPRVPAPRPHAGRQGPRPAALDRRGRGAGAAGLARRADRRRLARAPPPARSSPTIKQVFIGHGATAHGHAAFERKLYVDPQALRKGGGRARHPGEQVRLHPEPVLQHAHLQGHAQRRSDHRDVPGPHRPRRGLGAGAGASAVQHQHLPVLAAGASRTGTWRTTARSTRCAATSTGCAPARRCAARRPWGRTCARCCR